MTSGSSFRWIKGGNERCVVAFSSFAMRDYGPEAFSFRKFFEAHIATTDLLFVKDLKNQWYNRDLDGLGNGVDEIAQSLRAMTAGYKHVSCFGSSMGAYASLLYGSKLCVDHVVAASPQTFLSSPFPRFNRDRHKGEFKDVRDIPLSVHSFIDIVVGEDNLFDVYQCLPFMGRPDTYVQLVSNESHVVVDNWNKEGLLPSVIDKICTGSPPVLRLKLRELYPHASPVTIALTSADFRLSVKAAVEAFYAQDDVVAEQRLRQINEIVTNWLGAKAMLGEVLLRSGQTRDALELFDEVASKSTTIDEFYPIYAAALAKSGQHEKAMQVANRATMLNKSMKRIFGDIGKICEAQGLADLAKKCQQMEAA